MGGKTDKDVPGNNAEEPGQGNETPAARHAAERSNRATAQSPVQEGLRGQQELAPKILESARRKLVKHDLGALLEPVWT